jgi:hypothetical protein
MACEADINGELLHRRRQMLDAPLRCLVVRLAHDNVDVPGVVVDQRLAQGARDRQPASHRFHRSVEVRAPRPVGA